MDINRNDAVMALRAAGMRNPEELLGNFGQKGPFLDIELGNISIDEFHERLRPYFDCEVTDREMDEAFIAFLKGIPVERLCQLEQLHRDYRIYMLSNTNKLMWDTYILDAFKADGKDINHYFDGIVTSFETHAYKPDPAIFEAVVKLLGIKPEETLFFDDSQANVDSARRLGFHAELVTPGRPFISNF